MGAMMRGGGLLLLLLALAGGCAGERQAATQSVPLYNAAVPGLQMPFMGLGTGSYGAPGESWSEDDAEMAATAFLKSGGRRIDGALSYKGQAGIGLALFKSGVPRSELFLTSKIPLSGYNETLKNVDLALAELNTTYVDLLLVHTACPNKKLIDPICRPPKGTPHTACRLSVWRAMEVVFKSGKAKAIGVSNYVARHIQEILNNTDMLVPSVNQVEFQPYHHDDELATFCKQHNITFNTYAPLTTPDWAPVKRHWPLKRGVLDEPVMLQIAKTHNKTSAQVALRWAIQQDMVVNPRSKNAEHMQECVDVFDFELSSDDMKSIGMIKPPPGSDGRVCGDPYKCE